LLAILGAATWFAYQNSVATQRAAGPNWSDKQTTLSDYQTNSPRGAPSAASAGRGAKRGGKPLPSIAIGPKARPPKASEGSHMSLPFRKLPRHLVKQKLREAAEQGDGVGPRARLRKEDVREAVGAAKPAITECYEQALERSPKLAGRLKVEFTLVKEGGVGRLDDARIIDDEEDGAINHPFLAMCALKALADLEFPAPEGEGTMTVRYPFMLSPSERP